MAGIEKGATGAKSNTTKLKEETYKAIEEKNIHLYTHTPTLICMYVYMCTQYVCMLAFAHVCQNPKYYFIVSNILFVPEQLSQLGNNSVRSANSKEIAYVRYMLNLTVW